MFMGQVLQAGAGQITARQAAVNAGIPMTVPATTINKVCLSGLNAIYLADQMIQCGDADIVVAGGMESMTKAPYLLPGARAGYRIGDQSVVDSHDVRRPLLRLRPGGHGRRHREVRRLGRPRPASRRTNSPPSRTSGPLGPRRTACSTTRSSPSRCPQRKGDPIVVTEDEGVRGGDDRRVARQPAPGVRQGRQHHGRQRLADLRRRRGRHRRLQGRGRRARRHSRSARSSATARSPDPTRRCSPSRPGRSSRRRRAGTCRSATSTCSS